MVWSRLSKIICVCVLVCTVCATTANAASIYTNGNINNTYTTIFRDVIGGLGPFNDYVFFRSGEYDYTLVAGDLSFDGSRFSLDGAGVEYVLTYSSGYTNNIYNYRVNDISSFTLDTGNYLVYSNLGNYPQLESREVHYEIFTLFVIVVIGLCALIRPLFNFVLRYIRS